MAGKVIYIRDVDGALADELDHVADEIRRRTGENVSTASVARRIIRAGLDSPQVRRALSLRCRADEEGDR